MSTGAAQCAEEKRGKFEKAEVRESNKEEKKEKNKQEEEAKKRGRPSKEILRLREKSRTGSIGDLLTRKREREVLPKKEAVERRSKSTSEIDSPPRKTNKKEEKEMEIEILKELKEMKEEMRAGRMEMIEHIRKIEETWMEKEKKMDEKIGEIEARLSKIELKERKEQGMKEKEGERDENKAWKEIRKMRMEINRKEKRERKNNLIIRGIHHNEREDKEEKMRSFIEKEFKMGREVEKVETVKTGRGEILIIKMKNWEAKRKVMEEKGKLRERSEKIYIDDDLTQEERRVQRCIRERGNKERESGKRVKIGYRKIQINGVTLRWNEENERLEQERDF